MRSALILAGGASRRFGRPKALVPLGGRPMIRWVADAVRGKAEDLVVSVADANQEAGIRRILPQARVVHDRRRDAGPIEGLARGLEAALGELVLVAPCDAPLLRPALYDVLLEALGDRDAAVPKLEAIDPVRAVYRRDAALRVLARESVPSPSALVDRLSVAFVQEATLRRADPGLVSFLDVNAEEDLRRADAMRARVGITGRRSDAGRRTR
jgi:molybdopterin-guanine dinucleotide biosynthesis protein A